ncbi:MAG: cell division protein ZapA [Oscillospiraceae bacterium]|jgi:cell division protein ZapA|nr:cell division protein ZapA [Oscillospiraceae bacterium]
MKKKITVTVAGREYTLVSDEDESDVLRVAEQVNAGITEIMAQSSLSLTNAAVLTALNTTDKYQKAVDSAEHLRTQLREYLEEAQKLKAALAEARREITRLRSAGK